MITDQITEMRYLQERSNKVIGFILTKAAPVILLIIAGLIIWNEGGCP